MKITITTDYITLGQFLKLTRVISNGGDAKIFLLTTAVYVNDELEQRRGRKLRVGDKVMYHKFSGSEFDHDGTKYTLLKETDILCRFEKE